MTRPHDQAAQETAPDAGAHNSALRLEFLYEGYFYVAKIVQSGQTQREIVLGALSNSIAGGDGLRGDFERLMHEAARALIKGATGEDCDFGPTVLVQRAGREGSA